MRDNKDYHESDRRNNSGSFAMLAAVRLALISGEALHDNGGYRAVSATSEALAAARYPMLL
jgi:hypothetical protein